MATCQENIKIFLYFWQHCFNNGNRKYIIYVGGDNLATFAQRMKLLRKKNDITLDELAEKIQSTKATLSRYENDKRTPNIEFARKMAEAFGVTTDYLYGLTDDENEAITKFEDIVGFAERSDINAKALRDYIQFLNLQKNKTD